MQQSAYILTLILFSLQGGIGPAGLSAEDLHVLDLTQQRPRWHRLVFATTEVMRIYLHLQLIHTFLFLICKLFLFVPIPFQLLVTRTFLCLGLWFKVLGRGLAMAMSWLWLDKDILWQLVEMMVSILVSSFSILLFLSENHWCLFLR